MEIRIFGLADDSIVDGPGVRYTVFVQGCPHHCPGCHNPASHDFAGGTLMDTDGIIRKIGENPLLDGVTLSGGEPMCQPDACCAIADAAHAKHLNAWCYTGFTLDALLKENNPARRRIDPVANFLAAQCGGIHFKLARHMPLLCQVPEHHRCHRAAANIAVTHK